MNRRSFYRSLFGLAVGIPFIGNVAARALPEPFPARVPSGRRGNDPLLGEIMMFAGNFAPRGWALCDGQLVAISSNSALFSLLGTIYGGDGRTTFALPDLRGRVPLHAGSGPALSTRRLGEKGGTESEVLSANEMPSHNHDVRAFPGDASSSTPIGKVPAQHGRASFADPTTNAAHVLASSAVTNAGGNQAHNNMQPYLAINYCIALVGVYPSRN